MQKEQSIHSVSSQSRSTVSKGVSCKRKGSLRWCAGCGHAQQALGDFSEVLPSDALAWPVCQQVTSIKFSNERRRFPVIINPIPAGGSNAGDRGPSGPNALCHEVSVSQKNNNNNKQRILFFLPTSPNVDRFSKFFNSTLSMTAVKHVKIPPRLKYILTLYLVNVNHSQN